MSEETNTWEERAKEIVAENWENEHDLYLKSEAIKYSPDSCIELLNDFKEALKKEIEMKIRNSHIGYVPGLNLACDLIDTVKPLNHENRGDNTKK
jgi:hypothetical protein